VLAPLISILGNYITVPFPPISPDLAVNPATGRPFLISEMNADQIWSAYTRYIGAGAVLAGGLISLARALPTIISSAVDGLRQFNAGGASQLRTERDIPIVMVLAGSLALGGFLVAGPGVPRQGHR